MQMLGSHNSQYFAVALSDEVKLFRAPSAPSMSAQACQLVWRHKTDRVITGPMLALSDDGKVFLGGKEGLSYVCEGERGALRWLKVQTLYDVVLDGKESIAKIRVDRLGKTACWETTVPETSETSLMGFLKKLTTQGVGHSLFRLNLETGEQKRLATVSIAEKDGDGVFQWGVSPRFCHLGLAAPDNRGNTVQLIDLEYNSEPVDWDTPSGRIEKIDVNDTGHAVIHVRSEIDQLMVIGLQGMFKVIEPPPGFHIAYLGRTLVLHYEMRERLDIYNLAKGEIEAQIDLASLRLPATGSFHVTEEGSIYALLWNGTQLDVRALFLAQGTELAAAPSAIFEAPPAPPETHDSDVWATTVVSGPRVSPVAAAPPPQPTRSSIIPGRDSVERGPEGLPRTTPVAPQPSVIPSREPSRAPETLPRPAAVQQFVAPTPPPAQRMAPHTPPPVAEPIIPTPPPAASTVPPPASAAEERGSRRTEPPREIPTLAPPARGTPRSLSEIEEELTRLGLRYAAGDLSREEFLAQKVQWVGLKAFAPANPEAAVPLPLRLDLNL